MKTVRHPADDRLWTPRAGVLAALLIVLAGCGDDADPAAGPGPDAGDQALREELGLTTFGPIPYPADNPFSQERVELGRFLFFDPLLSGEEDVACATCHLPQFAFTDQRPFAVGVGGAGLGPERTEGTSAVSGDPVPKTVRNTTTVFNTGMAQAPGGAPSPDAPLFWDGRAEGLEGQALQPLVVREEMRGDAIPGSDEAVLDTLVARLRTLPGYVERFSAAFPDEARTPFDPKVVTRSTLARALAAYQRELVTRDAPFDRWVEGDDDALTPGQKAGMEIFFTKGRCFVCHADPLFGSFGFFVTGVPPAGRGGSVIPGDDAGREEHTGDPRDRYAFRVPSLRNVELTASYMHNGTFGTLEEVVDFYADGLQPRHPEVADADLPSILQNPIELDAQERQDLVAFMRALTDPGNALDPELVTAPDVVPSGLSYTGESADFIVMASIAPGGGHSCAVSGRGSGVPNGTVYCWGRNDRGQLGIGTASGEPRLLPVRVSGPAGEGGLGSPQEEAAFFRLTAGRDFTCGRTLEHRILCWGGGAVGGGHLRPAYVDDHDWEDLDGGDDHVCALTGSGRLFCWGDNGHGQLGVAGLASSATPREVAGGPFTDVAAGGRHTCAVTEDGRVLCWGDDSAGQLGVGGGSGSSSVPREVAGGGAFTDVGAGGAHSCAVDDGGRVWCWGDNGSGQLGRPLSEASSATPVAVEGSARFRSVDGGLAHTCAATTDLEPWCWGANGQGQLGIDGVEPAVRATPEPVRTSRRFSKIVAGRHHTCAIQDARGWCWGGNGSGQVGNGSTQPNLVPGVVIGKP